ncbi:MAG: acyloxyacyl hydrolase [Bacteroidota bacterium]
MKKVLSALFLCGFAFAYGQKSDWGIAASYRHGFLMAHRPIMAHLTKEHTNAFEASLFFETRGKKDWHKAYHYPTVGISVLATSAGNKEILGNYFGSFAFIQLDFLHTKHSRIYSKIGTGLGYTGKVFDQALNPKNVAVSSHINALINFSVLYQYRVERNQFMAGIDMTHFSNGASVLPNLGVNLTYFSLGYARKFQHTEEIRQAKEKVSIDRSWKYTVIGIASRRDSYPISKEKYPVFALALSTQKAFRHGAGYETGIDLMYKPSIRKYKPVIPKSAESMMQIGWYNGWFMSFDKMQVHVGMGIYLRDEYFADDRMYHRLGFRYAFKNGLLMNVTLKSHWAKADYVEYGIGYRF